MIRGKVPEEPDKPKTPEELKELADLKKAKQLLRQQHPVASKFAFVFSLLCDLLIVVYPFVLVGSFLMLWVAGFDYMSKGISYLLAGNLSAAANPPMSNDDNLTVVIFLALCLGGIILVILFFLTESLFDKYYYVD